MLKAGTWLQRRCNKRSVQGATSWWPLARQGRKQMDDTRFLIAEMAAKCQFVIRGSNEEERNLPKALHPKHLLWMCEQIRKHAQGSPLTRLHRWIGFVQAGILANRMLDLEQIKAMFDEVKKSHTVTSEDQDLIDHLDVGSSFKMDLGGQG
jgi:predicted small metal-binding protein